MTLQNATGHQDVHCPHCGLAVHVRAAFLVPDACPRCLARRRVAQPLQPGRAPERLVARAPHVQAARAA